MQQHFSLLVLAALVALASAALRHSGGHAVLSTKNATSTPKLDRESKDLLKALAGGGTVAPHQDVKPTPAAAAAAAATPPKEVAPTASAKEVAPTAAATAAPTAAPVDNPKAAMPKQAATMPPARKKAPRAVPSVSSPQKHEPLAEAPSVVGGMADIYQKEVATEREEANVVRKSLQTAGEKAMTASEEKAANTGNLPNTPLDHLDPEIGAAMRPEKL